MLGLFVDEAGVLLEDVEALGPGGVLELEHGAGVEKVVLAPPAPLVLAADLDLELTLARLRSLVGIAVTTRHLLGELVEARRRRGGSASSRSGAP